MKGKISCIAVALLLTVSGVAVADSHTGGTQCQDIRGRLELLGYEFDCSIDGESYFLCFDNKLKGKTKGTWDIGLKFEWYDKVIDGALLQDGTTLATVDGSLSFWYREYGVVRLKRGNLFHSAQYAVDERLWNVAAVVPIAAVITGGTGIYEDATGWILSTSDDFFVTAKISGEVCGPNIPHDDDDDDDDSDSDDD